jgi:hypothetical protein
MTIHEFNKWQQYYGLDYPYISDIIYPQYSLKLSKTWIRALSAINELEVLTK